jgi:serine/threonine-protein kinase RIO1
MQTIGPMRSAHPVHSVHPHPPIDADFLRRDIRPIMDFYQELAAALRERLALIADHELRAKNPDEQLNRLKVVSEKIEALKASRPGNIDPMLAHYLDRMSLTKALEFIDENHRPAA